MRAQKNVNETHNLQNDQGADELN